MSERTPGLDVVVTSLASDAHTWNLVYLQLVLEELGHRVVNVGACVPDELLVDECVQCAPDLVVVSSVNGHGFHDGTRVIAALRARPGLAATAVVIGGKLGTGGVDGARERAARLVAAGYDAVFEDGTGLAAFRTFLTQLQAGVRV
ncbi:methylaspartate mutase [Actinophytocola xinjiangensis]|uniref:Methylaspartate mutase n=1 Tax=Actinophytocola xinjiangensis TaxID=485602 RepID=A0A7Z1AWH9_9PSEU|nr:cobalamin-dependent protein [Actinophytocola xinjiangensis]OLF06961.1 methylaspartate mutase [Actinophytocola xinjiangensis]